MKKDTEINIINKKYLTMDEMVEQVIHDIPDDEEIDSLTLNRILKK